MANRNTWTQRPVFATSMLNAVERWAAGCYLLRETGAVLRGHRLDGLLIPTSWLPQMQPGIYGVEVKVSRSDFLRGLNSGQFERYAAAVNGLYLATGPDVCKTNEIPKQFGHLVTSWRSGESICVCRRKATRREADLDQATLWRIIWDLFDQFRSQQRKEAEEAVRLERRIKERASEVIDAMVKRCKEIERKDGE